MIVMLLVSILSVTVVLYLKPTNIPLLEANNIKLFMQKVRNQAVLQSSSYGIELTDNKLKVWKWSENKWITSTITPFVIVTEEIVISNVSGSTGLINSGPQYIVFSDGTLTPFEWQVISRRQPKDAQSIQGDLFGNIKLEALTGD